MHRIFGEYLSGCFLLLFRVLFMLIFPTHLGSGHKISHLCDWCLGSSPIESVWLIDCRAPKFCGQLSSSSTTPIHVVIGDMANWNRLNRTGHPPRMNWGGLRLERGGQQGLLGSGVDGRVTKGGNRSDSYVTSRRKRVRRWLRISRESEDWTKCLCVGTHLNPPCTLEWLIIFCKIV